MATRMAWAVRAEPDGRTFYALVASDARFAVDLFPTREAAEATLEQVLVEEPGFRDLLTIRPVNLSGADGRRDG